MHRKTKESSVRVFGSRKNQNLCSVVLRKSFKMNCVSEDALMLLCKELLTLGLKLIQLEVDRGISLNDSMKEFNEYAQGIVGETGETSTIILLYVMESEIINAIGLKLNTLKALNTEVEGEASNIRKKIINFLDDTDLLMSRSPLPLPNPPMMSDDSSTHPISTTTFDLSTSDSLPTSSLAESTNSLEQPPTTARSHESIRSFFEYCD